MDDVVNVRPIQNLWPTTYGPYIWVGSCTDLDNTGLFKMSVGVLTTCHTQYN